MNIVSLKKKTMKRVLYIKNMVCPRCKKVVNQVMQSLNLQVIGMQLGVVEVSSNEDMDLTKLDELLKKEGFELILEKEIALIEIIKGHMIEYLNNIEYLNIKFSNYLTEKMKVNYAYLSKIFSKNEKNTIEKYFIQLKIEKVKELVTYNQLSLSEIAYKLGYSSVHALSTQFKTIVGNTVSGFKLQESKNRKSLDDL